MSYKFPWDVIDLGKSQLWVSVDKNPERRLPFSMLFKSPWESKVMIHHFKDYRKFPMLLSYYSYDNSKIIARSGFYVFFFESFGEGGLVRGLYVEHPKERLDISCYNIMPKELPKIAQQQLQCIEEKEVYSLIRSVGEQEGGLEKDDIISRFGKDKSLIETYCENSTFYGKAMQALKSGVIRPGFAEFLNKDYSDSDYSIFNKKLCQAVCISLEEIVDNFYREKQEKLKADS